MIRLKFTQSMEINMDQPNSDYGKMLVNALSLIGFRDVSVINDSITFKSELKDQFVESFQRRCGDGKIVFKLTDKTLIITAITDTKRNFRSALLLNLGWAIFIILFGMSSNQKMNYILLLGGVIVPFVLEYFIIRALIKHDQKELLKLINKKIKNKKTS